MKDRRYANRGAALESYVRYANNQYARKKVAMIEKLPTEFIPLRNGSGQIYSAKVEHKSTVDFLGRYKSFPIAIEAKATNVDAIRFDRIEPHQADYMDAFTAQPGTIGLVLISFHFDRFFAIPWAFWGAAYDLRVRQGHRSVSKTIKAHGDEWTIPHKFSVRIEDLSPTWEVSGDDGAYGLHYLINADKYVTSKD